VGRVGDVGTSVTVRGVMVARRRPVRVGDLVRRGQVGRLVSSVTSPVTSPGVEPITADTLRTVQNPNRAGRPRKNPATDEGPPKSRNLTERECAASTPDDAGRSVL